MVSSVVGTNFINYDGKVHFNIIVPSLNLAKLRMKQHYKLSDGEKSYDKMGLHP